MSVPPGKGYGDVIPELKLKIPCSNFPADADIQPNMQFSSNMDGKENVFTVENIEGDQIFVDGNHPLTGETLHFNAEILGVRDATAEELSHGHVHDGSPHH